MKKVLIIADLFHASPRIPGLAKYLPEFGWMPVILTTHIGENPASSFGPPDDFRSKFEVTETDSTPPLRSLRSIIGVDPGANAGVKIKNKFNIKSDRNLMYSSLSWLYRSGEAIVNYPDPEKGWRPFAVEAGERLLKNGDIEAMISSSSPVTSHIIAKDLKNKYQTPWLADLRDLWSQNHNYHYGPIRNFFDRRLELNTLKTADALVTVSSICADELRRLHRRDAYTITNGFDPDKINSRKIGLTSKFTVTYTGQIYTGKQDTSIFCKALRDLILDETVDPKDVEVRFYGPYNESLARDIEEYDLQDIINQHGIIPRDRSFQKQAESQVLLLFNWEQIRGEDDEKGVYPLKIFEYLAAQRPIIATGGSGGDVVERMLNETGAGMYAPSVEDAKGSLKGLYHEYKQTNKIRYTNNIKQIDKYSYRTMAKRFAEILDSLA